MTMDNDNSVQAPSQPETTLDIVAVPPIGASPDGAWLDEHSQTPWPISELPKYIPNARILLADHEKLDSQDDIASLAQKLLNKIHEKRQSTISKRPIFFICHSTGGLVAKAALVIASQSTSNLESIHSSCHGIAFISTPHQGSSYLSAPEYAKSIHHLMRLKHHVPHRLRDLFKPRHAYLLTLSNQFKSISADMKIWTFLETAESTLTMMGTGTGGTDSTVEMHVPITSIRSGLLDLEHEMETPLATDHVGTASFKGQERTARVSFIKELQMSACAALELSNIKDNPLHVRRDVMVQVNGFFEDTARGVSDDTPLKLWSTKVSLHDYLHNGPSACLEERLKRTGAMTPSSVDDSSVSSFDSPPSSSYGVPGLDELSDQADVQGEGPARSRSPSPRPSLKKSRSFAPPISPRIHVSEPPTEYDSEMPPENPPSDQGLGISEVSAKDEDSEQDAAKEASSETPSSPKQSQRRLSTTTSPKYRSFLGIPPSLKDRLNIIRGERPPRVSPIFDRPEPGTEKLRWIHVPYTHTGWVPPVLAKACDDEERPAFFGKFINEEHWYSNLIRARHLEPHARFVRPACIHARENDSSPMNLPEQSNDPQLALYLPYLHWDTYWNLLQRRRIIEQRNRQGRSKPVPDHVADSDLESKLIWKYLGSEPPIHIRRTLDQFGYPNLRSTVARDDDQVVWKRTRKTIDLNEELGDSTPERYKSRGPNYFEDGKVLMVDQLWLWIVDQKTVVTFFPKQEATTAEGKLYEQANLHNSIYSELNGDLARRFETAGDLAALIVLHAVTILLDRTLQNDLQILRIFEESISILTESITRAFKEFRSHGFHARPSEFNKTDDGKPMTAAEKDKRDRLVAKQNRDDLTTLLELRDIMDELGTILKLLETQATAVRTMDRYFEDKGYGRVFIEVALTRIDDYRNQVTEMRENAFQAQKAVENLLDLKQKQANVDESRMARWQAEVTQNQSQAIMVFTIFTVIFLPLSFFTSLFGMNAREWSGEQTNLTLGTMFEIAAPTSVAIIIVALLMAFNERLRDLASDTQKASFNLTENILLFPFKAIHSLFSSSSQEPNSDSKNSSLRSKSSSTLKANGKAAAETSSVKSRFGRYFGGARRLANAGGRYADDDIWGRHEDRRRNEVLPSVLTPGQGRGLGRGDDGDEGEYFGFSEKRKGRGVFG